MKRPMISLLLLLTLCTGSALTQNTDTTSRDKLVIEFEQMPQFPGGDVALMKYISENIRYPKTEDCVEGRVIVQFVVTKTGEIGEVKVVRGVRPDFDAEAVRIVRSLPKFIPGRRHGEPVDMWYTLPVRFHMKHSTPDSLLPTDSTIIK